MKNKIINKLIEIIKQHNNIDKNKLAEIKYGLETIYLTIIKTIVFILIATLLDTTKELLYFMLFYGILRLTGFGVHAKKSLHCWVSSIITFVFIPLLIKYVVLHKYILFVLSFISLIILSIYAPADTPKRPLINKKKRIIYKLITIIITLIYTLIILNNKNYIYTNILLYSLLLESFLVTPLTYKMFGVSYKNYKNYKRKEKLK